MHRHLSSQLIWPKFLNKNFVLFTTHYKLMPPFCIRNPTFYNAIKSQWIKPGPTPNIFYILFLSQINQIMQVKWLADAISRQL